MTQPLRIVTDEGIDEAGLRIAEVKNLAVTMGFQRHGEESFVRMGGYSLEHVEWLGGLSAGGKRRGGLSGAAL